MQNQIIQLRRKDMILIAKRENDKINDLFK